MRKIGIIAVLSLLVTAFAAVPVLAQTVGPVEPTSITQDGGLHFCQGTTPTVTATKEGQTAFLTSNFEVCGAGSTATATLSADAVATAGCITKGGGEPRGLQTTVTPVVGSGTFETRAGRSGPQSVQTTAVTIPSTFECPSANQQEVLVSVLFTDVTLTVTSQTGTTTAFFGDIDP